MHRLALLCALGVVSQAFAKTYKAEQTNPGCPYAQKVSEQNIHGGWQGRVAPHTSNHCFFMYGEFLYWQAKEDGLEYASLSKVIDPATFTLDTTLKDIDFKWKPGFRAAVGYIFGENEAWDLTATYTYYRTHSHNSTGPVSLTTSPLGAAWSPFILGPFATEASANWKLSYNVVDLDLGRNYFVSKKLAIHPHIGLRGAFLYQHYEARYAGVFQSTTNTFTGNSGMIADNDFKAAGIRGGADFLWHFNSHWGIQGGLSGTLLYGQFDVPQDFFGFALSGNGGVDSLNSRNILFSDSFMRTRVNVEAIIGFFWETMIEKWGHHLMVNLGYEMSHWFDQNMLRQIITTFDTQPLSGGSISQINANSIVSQNGNLGLQGLTARLRYDF